MSDMKIWHRDIRHNFLFSLFAGLENAVHENARNDEYGKPIHKYIFLNHSFPPLGFLNCSIAELTERLL